MLEINKNELLIGYNKIQSLFNKPCILFFVKKNSIRCMVFLVNRYSIH